MNDYNKIEDVILNPRDYTIFSIILRAQDCNVGNAKSKQELINRGVDVDSIIKSIEERSIAVCKIESYITDDHHTYTVNKIHLNEEMDFSLDDSDSLNIRPASLIGAIKSISGGLGHHIGVYIINSGAYYSKSALSESAQLRLCLNAMTRPLFLLNYDRALENSNEYGADAFLSEDPICSIVDQKPSDDKPLMSDDWDKYL